MKIKLRKVTIRELVEGYIDSEDTGVLGYDRRLDIRPAYQREFVYDRPKEVAVIHSVMNGFPLGLMFWATKGDDHFEMLDGQQRTLAICRYFAGVYPYEKDGLPLGFCNLTTDVQDRFLSYELMVYVCEGDESEKLKWFQTINIQGERLTPQELLNAIYCGPFVSSARQYFSKRNCVGALLGDNYVSGKVIRQDLLELVLSWVSGGKDKISGYMAQHQNDENADSLWEYYKSVIGWVERTFTTTRSEMKSVPWGELYAVYGDSTLDIDQLNKRVDELMSNPEITKKAGIYSYVLDGEERHLNLRTFDLADKRTKYEQQKGVCAHCGRKFRFEDMDADHIVAWFDGGRTDLSNLQMLCRKCNRAKGRQAD